MAGGFKRSGRFGLILFALQRSDLKRTAVGDVKAVKQAVAEGDGQTENPTTMDEQQLWTALAVKPIDNEAVKARAQMWDAGRRSLRLGMIVTLLIFLTVPSIYLLESLLPLLIGGPLIVIAALYGSFRALAPGGEMDSAYDKVGLAMAPLGLEVTERPKVNIEVREATTGRVGPKIHGALVLSGERHGRPVSVRLGDKTSEVGVREPCKEYTASSKRVKVESDPEGISVTRKDGEPADWLCDLWLAERLADPG
jgi:hypothetical protein